MIEKNICLMKPQKSEQDIKKEQSKEIKIGESTFSFDNIGGKNVGWKIGDQDIIFPNHINEAGKDRGGNFICFPFFGPSPDGMEDIPQHGWLRDEKMEAENVETENDNKRVIKFHGRNEANEQYPWQLQYTITHSMTEHGLKISLEITRLNDGLDTNAPINPAFHPYFNSTSGENLKIGNYSPEISKTPEIIDNSNSDINIETVDGNQITMNLEGFKKICLWSDDSEKYSCVEPLLGDMDNFNSKKGTQLAKDEKIKLSMELVVNRKK